MNFNAHVILNSSRRLRGVLLLCSDSLNLALQDSLKPMLNSHEVDVIEKVHAGITASLQILNEEIIPQAAELDIENEP